MSTLNTVNITNGTDSITVEGAVKGSAKAWVNFNGTGTVAIRASYNVSSITDNGTGDYTVNFTTAMPDANYAASHGLGRLSTGHTGLLINNVTFATGSLRIQTTNASASGLDLEDINVTIFR